MALAKISEEIMKSNKPIVDAVRTMYLFQKEHMQFTEYLDKHFDNLMYGILTMYGVPPEGMEIEGEKFIRDYWMDELWEYFDGAHTFEELERGLILWHDTWLSGESDLFINK